MSLLSDIDDTDESDTEKDTRNAAHKSRGPSYQKDTKASRQRTQAGGKKPSK